MSKNKIEIPKISLSSTKKEMLEAFNEVIEKLEKKADAELNKERKKEEVRIQDYVAAADTLSPEKVVSDINTVKNEIGKSLAAISEKLETEVEKYQKIKEVFRVKNNELKETFEMEKSALIEAHNHKKQSFEAEIKELREKLEEEILETRLKWEKEKKEHADLVEELQAEEDKKRSREREEYLYNFEREKKLAQDKLKDEMDKLESELVIKKEQFEKEISDKKLELKEQEDIIQKMVRKIASMSKSPM